MRDYIQQHIKQPVAAYIKAIYEAAVHDYESCAYPYSSIHGSVTDRTMVKDSFVFGEVVMKGDCKMLGCMVAPETTVIMEPGAVAVNCMFGKPIQGALPRIIHIGKNSVVSWSQVDMQTTLGHDSCIYGSQLENDFAYQHTTPEVVIGNNSLLTNVQISIARPRCRFRCLTDDETNTSTPLFRFGNRTVIIRSRIMLSDITIDAGDDVLIGGYSNLLQTCLGELVDVTKVPDGHPAARGFLNSDSVLTALVPQLELIDETNIGSRVTIMASMQCHNTEYAATQNKVEIGDDVVVGIDQFIEAKEYIDESTYGLRVLTGNISLDSGSTLILNGRAKSNSAWQGNLHLGEGAIAVLSQARPGAHEAHALELSVTPYTTVRLL